MNTGKIFETNFKNSIPDNVYFQRIKDSASAFGQDSNMTRFSLNNPYDTFLFYNGNLFTIELKSTKSTSVNIQRNKTEKGKMIKLHQIEGLTNASNYDGIYSGFLIDFRDTENTYFLNIKDFNLFLMESDKKSINEKDVITYNGLLVDKVKKKVNYKYDVLKLLETIKGETNDNNK